MTNNKLDEEIEKKVKGLIFPNKRPPIVTIAGEELITVDVKKLEQALQSIAEKAMSERDKEHERELHKYKKCPICDTKIMF